MQSCVQADMLPGASSVVNWHPHQQQHSDMDLKQALALMQLLPSSCRHGLFSLQPMDSVNLFVLAGLQAQLSSFVQPLMLSSTAVFPPTALAHVTTPHHTSTSPAKPEDGTDSPAKPQCTATGDHAKTKSFNICDLLTREPKSEHDNHSTDAMSPITSAARNAKMAVGFQAGVTTGYTIDALVISDGRSKKRQSELSDAPSDPQQPQQQRYSCGQCGKSYATSSNLSRHKQTHRSLDSPHAKRCPHCDKVYVSMPALSMHLLTHKLEHKCTICNKNFSRPWLLQGHMRAHTGQKPFGCAHCGKAFADRSNLRAHMQTHSGAKKYHCPNCHKAFALKSYLNKHLESVCPSGKGTLPAAPQSAEVMVPVKIKMEIDPIIEVS